MPVTFPRLDDDLLLTVRPAGGATVIGPDVTHDILVRETQAQIDDLVSDFEDNYAQGAREGAFRVSIENFPNAPVAMLNYYRDHCENHLDYWCNNEQAGVEEFRPLQAVAPVYKSQESAGAYLYFSLLREDLFFFLTYCADRKARQTAYQAYHNLCSPGHGEQGDNFRIARRILELRQEMAKLLGRDNYLDYAFSTRSEKSPKRIQSFLTECFPVIGRAIKRNRAQVARFARTQLGIECLEPWDLFFVIQQMRAKFFGYDVDNFKQYFEFDSTIEKSLKFFGRLFAINFSLLASPGGNNLLKRYLVSDRSTGRELGVIRLDLICSPGKVNRCFMRSSTYTYSKLNAEIVLPEAIINCNFAPYEPESRKFFEYDEILIFFHELGHALEDMFTQRKGRDRFPEDIVEFSSKLFENFAYEYEVLREISSHYNTGAALPRDIFSSAVNYVKFLNSFDALYRLTKAMIDLKINQISPSNISRVFAQVAEKTGSAELIIFNPLVDRHLFADIKSCRYTANFYSYLYSEVMAYDFYSHIPAAQWPVQARKLRHDISENWGNGLFGASYHEILGSKTWRKGVVGKFKI